MAPPSTVAGGGVPQAASLARSQPGGGAGGSAVNARTARASACSLSDYARLLEDGRTRELARPAPVLVVRQTPPARLVVLGAVDLRARRRRLRIRSEPFGARAVDTAEDLREAEVDEVACLPCTSYLARDASLH